jgi:hypothetical protein
MKETVGESEYYIRQLQTLRYPVVPEMNSSILHSSHYTQYGNKYIYCGEYI